MDNDGTRNESIADGLIDAVAESNHDLYTQMGRTDRAQSDPAATGATGAQSDHTKTQTEKQRQKNESVEEGDASDNAGGLDTQDYSREKRTESEEDTTQETEVTSQEDTSTEVDDKAWQKDLPFAPGEFTVQPPQPDELGRVDADAYADYVEKRVEHNQQVKAYNKLVINKAFEAAEAVLPELKTNAALQNIIKQTYLSEISAGNLDANPVAVARELRSFFDSKVAEGASNTRTQITIEKNASVEKTGAAKPKSTPKKDSNFERRLAKNDTAAFEELIGGWVQDGKI